MCAPSVASGRRSANCLKSSAVMGPPLLLMTGQSEPGGGGRPSRASLLLADGLKSHPVEERAPSPVALEHAKARAGLHLSKTSVSLHVGTVQPVERRIDLPTRCVDLGHLECPERRVFVDQPLKGSGGRHVVAGGVMNNG